MDMAELPPNIKSPRVGQDFVDAAIELFDANGYDRTTVAELSAAATQSRSTFFRYFGSKEDVLFHDVPAHLEMVKASIARRLHDGDEPWTAVTQALMELIRTTYVDSDGLHKRLTLWQREPALRARWAEYSSQWETAIAQILSRQRRVPAHSDEHAQVIAVAAIGAFRIAVACSTDGVGEDFLAHVQALFRRFEAGITTTSVG
jgi:AcrR family transcriptional regulator